MDARHSTSASLTWVSELPTPVVAVRHIKLCVIGAVIVVALHRLNPRPGSRLELSKVGWEEFILLLSCRCGRADPHARSPDVRHAP